MAPAAQSPAATAPPREPLRASPGRPSCSQARSRPRPAFLRARSAVAALLPPGLALRPPSLEARSAAAAASFQARSPAAVFSRSGRAGARVGPCCVSARGSRRGRGAERSAGACPSRPPRVACPPSSAVRSQAEPKPGGDSCTPGPAPRACRHHRHRSSLVPAMAFVLSAVLVTDLDREY